MSWKATILTCTTAALVWAGPLTADWKAGLAAFEAGDLAAAEAEFRAAVEAWPEWAGGHRMLGQTLVRGGRTEEGLPSLERAAELAPDDLAIALFLGQTYLVLERFSDAAEVLAGRAPAALPASERARFFRTRGQALVGAGEHRTAIADLQAALGLAPEDVKTHRLLGQVAEAAGRDDLAVAHFGRVTELEPSDAGAWRAWTRLRYNRAAAREPAARVAACEEVMPGARKLVALEESYENLTLLQDVAKCSANAVAELDALGRASAVRPEDWRPEYEMGRALLRHERWAEAGRAFERALGRSVPDEEKARVLTLLGYAFEKQSRLPEALAQYRLAEDPEAVARVEQNIKAEEEATRLRKLAEEAKRLEDELANLGKSGG